MITVNDCSLLGARVNTPQGEGKIILIHINGAIWVELDNKLVTKYNLTVDNLTLIDNTELVEEIVNFYNLINQRDHKVSTYQTTIKKVLKKLTKKYTMDFHKAVMSHKAETWGKDDKMKVHNNLATIYRNPEKFKIYVQDAIDFYRDKSKRENIYL